MTPWRCAATALLLGAGWGCAASDEPTFELSAVSPNMAFNDAPLSLMIRGNLLRPNYRFDTMAGAATAEAGGFSVTLTSISSPALPTPTSVQLDMVMWQSPVGLTAMLPARVQPGDYDVVVTDPRGQRHKLSQAFTSLGPDQQAPTVTILAPEPRSIVAAGSTVSIILAADDGHGIIDTLDVAVSTDGAPDLLTYHCPVTLGAGQVPCVFEVTAPAPASDSDMLVIAATAIDSVGNASSTAPASFRLVPRPSATGMSPTIGPSRGGTEIVVQGADFVVPIPDVGDVGSQSRGTELLFDGQLVLPEMVTATEIRAVTPPHDAGHAMVRVVSGGAPTDPPMDFEYVAAPSVRTVCPTHGPLTGGTRIAIVGNHFRDQVTTFFAGNTPLLDPYFVSINRVEATMPAMTAPGPVAIVSYDEIGGTGLLQDAFTYDPADAPQADPPDGGGLQPTLCPTGVP